MKRRTGFTLIELLVVIAIIAILIGLLLPAVQKVRAAAQRMTCLNNLKQISLAMHLYADSTRKLPMGSTQYHGSGTWQASILPCVEQQNLFDGYQSFDGGVAQAAGAWSSANVSAVTGTQIKIFTCPTDTPVKSMGQTYSGTSYHNYAVNFGTTAAGDSFSTAVMRIQPTFNGLTDAGSPFRMNEAIALNQIDDGTSNTLMVAEVIQGRGKDLRGFTWWGDAAGFVASLRPNDTNPDFVTHSYCDPTPPNPPANCTGMTTSDNFAIRAFASRSRHGGGVCVSMCDGSTRFVTNSITAQTWQAMSTSKGGETIADY